MELEAWRRYLDTIIKKRKPVEKESLYRQIGITRITVQRWRNGDNIPDPVHIHSLLQALEAEERDQLRILMQKDARLQMPNVSLLAETERIPQHIYQEVLRISRDTSDRFWLVGGTVLFHMLAQLSIAPEPVGLDILVARCMPPRADGGKIRSLRAYAARGTAPWRTDFHPIDGFFGAESLMGDVVTHRHSIMIPDVQDTQTTPLHCQDLEQSAAAVPIMREGRVVGALAATSNCTHFFTNEKLALIERYADLLLLAFFDAEFYPQSIIELALMPDLCTQKPYFTSFRQRVSEEYKQSIGGESLQDVGSIEQKVRQDLETELLRLAGLAGAFHPA